MTIENPKINYSGTLYFDNFLKEQKSVPKPIFLRGKREHTGKLVKKMTKAEKDGF